MALLQEHSTHCGSVGGHINLNVESLSEVNTSSMEVGVKTPAVKMSVETDMPISVPLVVQVTPVDGTPSMEVAVATPTPGITAVQVTPK